MKTKLDRTVPSWVQGAIGFIIGGAFANTTLAVRGGVAYVDAYLIGSLIGLFILWLVLHWIIGWCFAALRAFRSKN